MQRSRHRRRRRRPASPSSTAALASVTAVAVGGNDAGFSTVLSDCGQHTVVGSGLRWAHRRRTGVHHRCPSRSARRASTSEMRRLAPHANVVIVGYPRLFMGEDCNAGTWIQPWRAARPERHRRPPRHDDRGNCDVTRLRLRRPRSAFTGHAVCDDEEWVSRLSDPVSESFIEPRRSALLRPISSTTLSAEDPCQLTPVAG
ncbi:MAG: hypothetical protein WKF58_13245 [Ilumatobacteraceae bacterium]